MSKIEAERAAFEAYLLGCGEGWQPWHLRTVDGEYQNKFVKEYFGVWQARASLPAPVPTVGCTKPGCFPYCDCGGIDDAAPTVKAEQVDMADAYVGAREDLAIWKRRALEAEQKVRHQEQIIDRLTLEAQGETRFGEPSMPSAEPVAVIEYAGYDPANSIKWLNKGLQYMEPGTLLYAQAPSLPAAGSSDLTAVRCQCCATEYPHDSYDAGFIAGSGMCQVCDAAMPPKDLPAAGSAVEEVEVVGYRFFHVDHGYIFRRTHIYEGNPSLEAHSLMTVAQHERIVATLSAQQSAPERVSVQVKLLRGISFWLERTNEKSDEDIAELIELRALLASHGRGEA